jgi:inosine-uridine nucleoside N-ribohydrolase
VLVREVSRRAFEVRGRNGVHLHDPLAVAVVEHPELVDTRQGEIAVDVGPRHRGRTRLSVEASGWGSVAAGVDVKKFDERFGRLLDG